ncbi:putative Acetylgalactosaminyl-O-glycosyl-glycoprotein beta-1,3-N-acetylglucosaminyltransferase [Daphnia magna]|uniref:Hexosyltransferase n=1 Tax=Daphnia magna TaxID=35525 RepID=A0A0P5C916_9CRUS|nr:putative Acetylgalactosaminyl-O-glycosyl-glycoprotein beta-1,3-N-acetylglucosaminyltransferase [Daphnia magna]
MKGNFAPFVREIRARFLIVFCILLLLVVGSIIYFIYFMQPSGDFSNQQQMELKSTPTLDERINILVEEKQILEVKVKACEEEKKKFSLTLGEKIKLLKDVVENSEEQLIQRLEKDVQTLQANATIHQEFFNYFSNVSRQLAYPGVEFYTRYNVARLGLRPLAGIEPLKPEFGPVINDVLSYQYSLTVPPCRDVAGVNRTVFVAIISATDNFEKRNTTRPLWPTLLKAQQDKGVMGIAGFAFILGKPDQIETQKRIEEESQMYGDIIQIEMVDTYRNLTLKLVGLFNWLHTRNCSKVDFVVKADDDVFVNVRNLAHFVQSQPRHDTNLTIFGTSAGNLWPARDGKWELTYEEWPWHRFPRYFNGPAVLFPGNTIVPLLASFQTTPMLHIDDLYFSGICVERAGIKNSYSTNSTKYVDYIIYRVV